MAPVLLLALSAALPHPYRHGAIDTSEIGAQLQTLEDALEDAVMERDTTYNDDALSTSLERSGAKPSGIRWDFVRSQLLGGEQPARRAAFFKQQDQFYLASKCTSDSCTEVTAREKGKFFDIAMKWIQVICAAYPWRSTPHAWYSPTLLRVRRADKQIHLQYAHLHADVHGVWRCHDTLRQPYVGR